MAFPEGKRSQSGRLEEFKGGIFSMAVKANVPIVPISISNTHAVMPSNALFPFQNGNGKLHVHVHEPIEVEGRTEEELVAMVREALLSRMPLEQHPLERVAVAVAENVGGISSSSGSGSSIDNTVMAHGDDPHNKSKVQLQPQKNSKELQSTAS
jgi:1-acyl-sn-glycerol-3-phosphate acyltransferase